MISSDCEVTGEVTSDPEQVRISGPVSPADLIQLLDSCPLPDYAKLVIRALVQPHAERDEQGPTTY